MRYAFFGLIVCLLTVCQPQAEAQFLPFAGGPFQRPGFIQQPYQQQQGVIRGPRQGSVSKANTNAYERNVDFGNVELTKGVSNSRAVTKTAGGQRSVANSNAQTREINLGGLEIGNTLTRTRTNTNGAVSGGISDQFRVGDVGLGASLSPQNLRNGFGLQRGPDGDVRLGLGLLNLDLDPNVANSNSLSQAQVNAQGRGAQARANSNAQTNTQQYGGVSVTDTRTNSNAVGRTRFGQTSANTGGFGGNAITQGSTLGGIRGPFLPRRRRTPVGYRQLSTINRPASRLSRPKRRAQFVPFGYPQENFGNFEFDFDRPRRQFGRPGAFQQPSFQQPGFGGFQQPGFGGFQQPGFGGFGGPSFQQPGKQGTQGAANANGGPGFNQQAAVNSHSNRQNGPNGFTSDQGTSSISSNLAQDGNRGQVSSANTNQQKTVNAAGTRESNNAQSQSLNFQQGQQQATSSNANTLHTQEGNRQTIGSNSGSTSTNNNQFGSATNIANTNTQVEREGNRQTVTSGANSQSILQGNNGQGNAAANTNANISSQRGPNGFVTNSASSSATATSQGGQSANASANASAGGAANRGGSGAGANAGANSGIAGGANSNSNVLGGFNNFRVDSRNHQPMRLHRLQPMRSFVNTSNKFDTLKMHHVERLEDLRPDNTSIDTFGSIDISERQGRTFSFISDLVNNLFNSCVNPCTLEAFQQNRCCQYPIVPVFPVPPPVPVPAPPQVCCSIGPTPPIRPPPPPPPPPRRPPVVIVTPPINCCTVCSYTYYGPPPCGRYFGDNRRVPIYVPPPYFGR